MKKILALILALCTVFMFTACGGSDSEEAASDGDQVTLKLWCIATESDANRPAYLQAIEDYEAAHPNVKIEMEAFENESYKKLHGGSFYVEPFVEGSIAGYCSVLS